MTVGFHTFDPEKADRLDDESRYRFLSRDELVAALGVDADATAIDLGSGTGFYTDDVAPHVGTVHAVDVQPEMHDHYREHGVPENVELVVAEAGDVPLPDGCADAVFSTMTYHEFASPESAAESARLLQPGGRVVHADWSAAADGVDGPSVEERYAAADAVEALEDAGFEVLRAEERPETFLVVAERV